jgi:hypothetical protein
MGAARQGLRGARGARHARRCAQRVDWPALALLQDWVQRYKDNRTRATAELLTFLIQVCSGPAAPPPCYHCGLTALVCAIPAALLPPRLLSLSPLDALAATNFCPTRLWRCS